MVLNILSSIELGKLLLVYIFGLILNRHFFRAAPGIGSACKK